VKLSTRLLLPLLATVALVMLAFAWFSIRRGESVMLAEAERETRAYAKALGLALERAVGESDPDAVQEMIERIDRGPNIYGVVIYDAEGAPQYISPPLASAERATRADIETVLGGASPQTLRRFLAGGSTVTVLSPLVDEAGGVHGVLEVVQPIASLDSQLARTRARFLLNTLTLLVAVTLLLSLLVRRYLSEPLSGLVRAVRALGSDDPTRVETESEVRELREVGLEIERTADRLSKARQELLREGEERVSRERRLHQYERLAEVGRLAADLAQEIGAPLLVIRGRAEIVERGEVDRERNLRIIIEQVDRISEIVRTLLGYARRRVPKPVDVDLVSVVRSVVAFLEVESRRQRTDVVFDAQCELIPVYADPDLLHQVFVNVILNALHAVSEGAGSKIMIRMKLDGDAEAGVAVVDVEDDGPGIPVELRDRVFDPFFTTKAAERGTGLGLALARAIVEDHGGVVVVMPPSASTWSTRLHIELPLESEAVGASRHFIAEPVSVAHA
jgi:signal transduction histidine kinase